MAKKIKNVEDAIMKSIMDVFKEDALQFSGINSKIITAARTELKNLKISTSFMDYTFLLDEKYQYLKEKIQNDEKLTRQDLLCLVFLPLMSSTKDKNERILESIKLSKEIKDKVNQMNSLALLYTFAEKFIDEENLKKLMIYTNILNRSHYKSDSYYQVLHLSIIVDYFYKGLHSMGMQNLLLQDKS